MLQTDQPRTSTETCHPMVTIRPTQNRFRSVPVLTTLVAIAVVASTVALGAWKTSGRASNIRAADTVVASSVQASTEAGPGGDLIAISTPLGVSTPRVEETIIELEARVKANPADGAAWRSIAGAYLRQAFETADPSYYSLSRSALDKAASLLDNSAEVRILRANLMLALHDFEGAKAQAISALSIEPTSFGARVALTDATIETGDYASARDLVDTLIDTRPGVASLSRLSYYRQLTGDIDGAEAAMRAAVSAAPADSIDRAVALGYLGEIQLEQGSLDPAQRSFSQALQINPASSVAAIGLARVHATRGEWADAVKTLEDLAERAPTAGAYGLLADIARARGDKNAAAQADQLVDASVALLKSNGAIVDADLAALLADRGPGAALDALDAASQAHASRNTIFTNDSMAWALTQAGRTTEAVPYVEAALATNPQVASIHWHAAVIFDAQGDRARATTALAAALQNSTFSLAQQPAVHKMAHRYGLAATISR